MKKPTTIEKIIETILWLATLLAIFIICSQCSMEITNTTTIQWRTHTEHVNAETGEIMTPRQIKKGDYILIQTIKLKTDGTNKIKKVRRIYRRNNQRNLFE